MPESSEQLALKIIIFKGHKDHVPRPGSALNFFRSKEVNCLTRRPRKGSEKDSLAPKAGTITSANTLAQAITLNNMEAGQKESNREALPHITEMRGYKDFSLVRLSPVSPSGID